ncbi:cell number regulator 6, partial [Dorcoceras hygrometricum]
NIMQLHVQRSFECEYPFQEGFHGPAKEPWSTGIFECAQDRESCLMGLFCPCVLFGRNVEQVTECTWIAPCVCHAVFVEGGIALAAATAALHGCIGPATAGCICEVLFSGWMMSGLCTGTVRESLEDTYHLERWPCDACLVHSYLHWCAICQEHRELKACLRDDVKIPMTIVNPPPVQKMS